MELRHCREGLRCSPTPGGFAPHLRGNVPGGRGETSSPITRTGSPHFQGRPARFRNLHQGHRIRVSGRDKLKMFFRYEGNRNRKWLFNKILTKDNKSKMTLIVFHLVVSCG